MTQIPKIVGHRAITTELQQDLTAGNVSHAYLFTGAPHLGKTAVARWFALQLILHGKPESAHADIQKRCERLTHPDLLILDQLWIGNVCEDWNVIARTSNVPQQHRAKKPVAKTDSISIEDIRALQERLHDTGTGSFRCCIIRNIERMQPASANAFLKILEEPPAGLVFMLTTRSPGALLPTVLSRTRVLRFLRLPHRDLLPLLKDISETDAHFIMRIAQGAPGTVQALVQNPDALRIHKQMHEQARAYWDTQLLSQRLRILHPLQEQSENAQQLLFHLALTLRHMSQAQLYTHSLQELARGLQTNANRQLVIQRFALSSPKAQRAKS